MKATINFRHDDSTPWLLGNLGIPNVPYTAILVLTKPDGSIENLTVGSSDSDYWEVALNNYQPGTYDALISPRVEGAFEATRTSFTL